MKRFMPLLGPLVAALAPIMAPDVQNYMAQHPQLAAGFGAIMMTLYHFLPSPLNVQPKG